jgi:uncharacterized protein YegL
MNNISNFSLPSPRPLPVILLLDGSGSMSQNDKITSLNNAVGEMIRSFAYLDSNQIEIHVAVLVFNGDTARLQQDLQPAQAFIYQPIVAEGRTPLGSAFNSACDLIEDQSKIPGRAYAPTIVLVSDGEPTDIWEPALEKLLQSPRATKAQRFALAIGEDANIKMLSAFVSNPDKRVFKAAEASQIQNFFHQVTMSVTQRFYSQNPNITDETEDNPFEY